MTDFEDAAYAEPDLLYGQAETTVEPEPEPEPTPSGVKVRNVLPGSYVAEDGKLFVFNRWVEVTQAEAEKLLSLTSSGRQRFVSSDS